MALPDSWGWGCTAAAPWLVRLSAYGASVDAIWPDDDGICFIAMNYCLRLASVSSSSYFWFSGSRKWHATTNKSRMPETASGGHLTVGHGRQRGVMTQSMTGFRVLDRRVVW